MPKREWFKKWKGHLDKQSDEFLFLASRKQILVLTISHKTLGAEQRPKGKLTMWSDPEKTYDLKQCGETGTGNQIGIL